MTLQIAEFRPKTRKPELRCNVWQGHILTCTLRLALTSYHCPENLQFEASWV